MHRQDILISIWNNIYDSSGPWSHVNGPSLLKETWVSSSLDPGPRPSSMLIFDL